MRQFGTERRLVTKRVNDEVLVNDHLAFLLKKKNHYKRSAELLGQAIKTYKDASRDPSVDKIELSLDAYVSYERHEQALPRL